MTTKDDELEQFVEWVTQLSVALGTSLKVTPQEELRLNMSSELWSFWEASQVVKFNYDLEAAPRGRNLQLLTIGKITIIGEINAIDRAREMGIVGWALCAVRNKEEEIKYGLISAATETE